MLKQLFPKPALNNDSALEDAPATQHASAATSPVVEPKVDDRGSESLEEQASDDGAAAPDEKDASAVRSRFSKFSFPLLGAAKKATRAVASVPKRNVAALLGIASASTGFAFTQVAPTEMQSAVLPERLVVEAPLRRANDPAAEVFVINTRGLFLTHQIFYRKVEAIARISGSVVTSSSQTAGQLASQPIDQAASQSATSPKEETTQGSKSSQKTAEKKTASASAATQSESPKSSEQVIAAAPPAPAVAQPVFTGTTIDSVLEMRVAVAKDVSAISFATSGEGTLTDLDGNVLKSLSPETGAYAEIGDGLVVDGEVLPDAFWVYPEDGGYVAIGNSWYRGRVLLALRERGLIAVNYVLLGDYLYSVVGSEMSPGWAIESLKAQAVAARSYALTHNIHPASEAFFDLDNTQRFQAYKGIGREADTTQTAVQATAGEFISHDGGIVESLYAASQAIVDDAHKGSGMSQLGAKDLAEQGYDYTAILGHYYPGTALGRIETDSE
ncbi:MAG: SpoIID/LytB domain-containing protein [Cyanobacteria bacterium J06635_11]